MLLLLFLACMTDNAATVSTLHKAGYSDIRTDGYAWLMCGDGDTYHTAFTAKNPAGETVSGAVCCGMWSKGCTIRY